MDDDDDDDDAPPDVRICSPTRVYIINEMFIIHPDSALWLILNMAAHWKRRSHL